MVSFLGEAFQHGPTMWAFIYVMNALLVTWSHVLKKQGVASVFLTQTLPVIATTSFISLPFLLPEHDYQFRGAVVMASSFYAIKLNEVVSETRFENEPLWIKIAGVIGTFWDAQERKPAQPWGHGRIEQIKGIALHTGIHFVCYLLTVQIFLSRSWLAQVTFNLGVPLSEYDIRVAIGCISACVFVFYCLHLFGDFLALIWCTAGYTFPPLMDSPEQSLSVREFWLRWDTVIQKLLRKNVFLPAKEMGVPLYTAAFLTFMASGVVHILPILLSRPEDWLATFSMMSYFIIQFGLIMLEKPLGIYKWGSKRRFLARFWTIACLFGPSYLLVLPCLRLAKVRF